MKNYLSIVPVRKNRKRANGLKKRNRVGAKAHLKHWMLLKKAIRAAKLNLRGFDPKRRKYECVLPNSKSIKTEFISSMIDIYCLITKLAAPITNLAEFLSTPIPCPNNPSDTILHFFSYLKRSFFYRVCFVFFKKYSLKFGNLICFASLKT